MTDPYKNHSPFFSIGIPAYNRLDLLKISINSLLRQEFTDFEIIVANDHTHRDLSKEMLGTQDERIIIVNNRVNLGELANMNSILAVARGRYFSWQFDDDLCSKSYLKESYNSLKDFDFPKCVFSSFGYVYGSAISDFNSTVKNTHLFSGRGFLRSFLSGEIRVLGTAGFIKTELIKSYGGAIRLSDGKMAIYSEYLLIFKSALQEKVVYNYSQLVAYRVHGDSWSCKPGDVDLYRQAGIKLLSESIPLFSEPVLREDFSENLTSLLKSIISVVVTKSRMAGIKNTTPVVNEFISDIKNVLGSVKDIEIHNKSQLCLNKSLKYLTGFKIKSWIRSSISPEYLKIAHIANSFISRFVKKPF